MQREAVAHAEQRVHEPAEAEDPRVLGDRLVDRRVPVGGDHLDVGGDVVAPPLGADAVAELAEQVDQVLAAVQPHAVVADEVAERRDRLHVVADVRRRLRRRRMAVVHHRERPPPAGGRRGGRRVRVRLDPGPHPVPVQLRGAPQRDVLARVALEDREQLARELRLAVAPDRREQLVPALGPDLRRVVGGERADLPQRLLRRDLQAGADVLRGRVDGPGRAREPAQLLPRQLAVAAPGGGDAAGQPAELRGLRLRAQRFGERDRRVVLLGADERAHLRDDRTVQRLAAREQPDERLAVRRPVGLWRRRDGGLRRGRRRGRGGAEAAAHARRQDPPAEAVDGAHERTTCSFDRRSNRHPSRPAKYSSTAVRQPDHWK